MFEIDENCTCWKKWVLRPENYFRFGWEMLIMVILISLGFIIPFTTAFMPDDQDFSASLDLFLISVFSLDIFLNFNTGYYFEGKLITDRKDIAKNYLKFWFWVDMISTVPIDSILDDAGVSNQNKYVKYVLGLRVLKLIRLIRLTKLKFMIIRIKDRISNKKILSFITILKLVIYLLLVAHFFACIMFAVSSQNMYPDNFLNKIINKSDSPIDDTVGMYITSLYWAFTTMSSIGYGDISPQTSIERIVGVLTMITSSGIFGFIIGNIGTVIENYSIRSRKKRETLVSINNLLKVNKIHFELRRKIRNYIDFVFNNEKTNIVYITEILKSLSSPLQAEILMHTYGAALKAISVFDVFPGFILHKFSFALQSNFYSPNNLIIKEGQVPAGIHIISKGRVCIFDDYYQCIIKILNMNESVGEIGLFTGNPCIASALASDYVETYLLSVKDFETIIDSNISAKECIDVIRRSCVEGNYSALKIRCYLCLNIGHIARHCDEIMNSENAKKSWLKKRLSAKTVKKRGLYKLKKKLVRDDYSLRNVVGDTKGGSQMSLRFRKLWPSILKYLKITKRISEDKEKVNAVYSSESVASGVSEMERLNCERFLEDSEEERKDDKETVRMRRFDMGLI